MKKKSDRIENRTILNELESMQEWFYWQMRLEPKQLGFNSSENLSSLLEKFTAGIARLAING